MFKKKGKIVTLGIITSFVLGAFLFSGVTFAAFLNQLRINNEIKVDTSKAEGKFASGNGTKESPYLINSAEQLRNLQKLNMLDLFDSKTYFVLPENGTIDCTGVRLKPIGTEDHPFDSQFNGRGCKIKNLTIDGRDTEDIGMFGYTGINSRVMNFFLIHPIINVLYNSDGKGFEPSTNVLAKDESVTGVAKTLTLTGSNATANKSVITIPSSNKTEINLSSGRGTLPIKYASTNPQVYDPNVSGDYIKYPEGVEIYSGLYTFQIYAYIEYYDFEHVIDAPELVQYKYVLERWNVELKCVNENNKKSVSINLREDKSTLNIYPTKHRLDNGVRQDHGLNVGFFIGHCDGGASHLGLYGGATIDSNTNGIIYLNGRAAKSTGSLIGRDRLDNPLDNTAKNHFNKFFDFAQVPFTKPGYSKKNKSELDKVFVNGEAHVLEAPSTPFNEDARKIILDINERSQVFTDELLNETGITTEKDKTSYFARYYPKAIAGEKNGSSSIATIGKGKNARKAIRIDSPSRAGTYLTTSIKNYKYAVFEWQFVPYSVDSNFFLENAVWFWATREFQNGFFQSLLQNLTGKPDVFKATLKFKYVVTPKDANKLTNLKFDVMNNPYYYGRRSYGHTGAGIGDYDVPDFKNTFWKTLEKGSILDKEVKPGVNPWNLITDVSQYNSVVEKSINFTVSIPASSDRDLTSPMFFVGIDTAAGMKHITNSPSAEMKEYYGGHNATNDVFFSPYYPDVHKNGTDWDFMDRAYYVRDKRLYSMHTAEWDPNIDHIDLLDIDLSFNTKDGNTSSLTNNVDFLSKDPMTSGIAYKAPAKPTDKPFSGWETPSNTKIAFDLKTNDSTAVNNYYRAESGWLIKSTTVYLYYTSSNGTYVPTNTKGYSSATIGEDTSLTAPPQA